MRTNSMWMNEMEIEDAANRFRDHAVLGPASRFLLNFCREVNRHSDGWPYWRPAGHSASRLMALVYGHLMAGMGAYPRLPAPTEADVKKCLPPIKAFMTRRGNAAGMSMPELR